MRGPHSGDVSSIAKVLAACIHEKSLPGANLVGVELLRKVKDVH